MRDSERERESEGKTMLLAYTKRHKHKSHLPTTWFTHCMLQSVSWFGQQACHIAHASYLMPHAACLKPHTSCLITNVRLSAFQLCAIYVGQPLSVWVPLGVMGSREFRVRSREFNSGVGASLDFCMCRHIALSSIWLSVCLSVRHSVCLQICGSSGVWGLRP